MDEQPPVAMIAFLMRTVSRLEISLAEKTARVVELEAFIETFRDDFESNAVTYERFAQLMDGDRKQ